MNKNDLLLVIDMQNVYKKGGKWECLNTEGAAQNINKIIEAGEKIGWNKDNVIFTRFIANEKNPYGVWKNYNEKYESVNHDQYANEMVSELAAALKKYPLYTKGVYSSTEVPEVLEAARKTQERGGQVIVSGVVAECCVLSTVLALMDHGIYTVYVTDAVSGLDEAKEEATKLIFKGLSPLHVKMMKTEDYIFEDRS